MKPLLVNQMRRFSKKKTLFYALLLNFIILSGAEIILRVFPIYKSTHQARAGFVIPDKDLLWRLQPREYGELATNSLGFRDTAYNSAADVKIVVLGDSVSWGDGMLSTKQTFPYLLERHLNKKNRTVFEVINASVPGYSTFQHHVQLKKLSKKVQPQFVILQFCLNDVTERYRTLANYGGSDFFLGVDTRSFIQGAYGFFVRNSKIFETFSRLYIDRKKKNEEYTVTNLARGEPKNKLEPAWKLVFSEIDKVNKIAKELKVPFLLVVAPYHFQLDNPNLTGLPQKKIARFARQRNIDLLDLLPEFSSKHKNKRWTLFHDANHFSVLGHHLAAKLIHQELIQKYNY